MGIGARCLLLTLTAVLLSAYSRADEPRDHERFDCGRDILRHEVVLPLSAEALARPQARAAATGLDIVLNVGPGLAAEPEALATFERAAEIWESKFSDPVTVVIDADLDDLPSGVLGSTGSRSFLLNYGDVLVAMVVDSQANETIVSDLPSLSQYSAIVPSGFGVDSSLIGTKANLRALGFDMSFDDGNPDASITFSTGFLDDFDFDPSDGIASGLFDFEAIAVHEIGHALGFTSTVDTVDFVLDQGGTTDVSLRTLDMFRLRPGDAAVDFTTSPRIGSPGNLEPTQVFFDGAGELGLSTGRFLGDGRQASHWKANELTGLLIGIMDPTLGRGERLEVGDNDIRAFGLIGWDVICTLDCGDGDPCTFDECVGGACVNSPVAYGDVNGDGAVNLFDVFCVLDGIGGDFSECDFSNVDIEPCVPNGTLNLLDVFALLNAIGGTDPCCGP